MADGYSVGNLKIAFNTVDQTSNDFKKLATSLRAIVNLINRISTADLGKFSANVKGITKAFNPFLTKLEKSTAGLQAFDSIARQLGVRNISNVATVFNHLPQATKEAAKGVGKLNVEIGDGKEVADNYAKAVSNVATAAAEIKNPFDAAQAEVAKLTHEMLNLHFATGQVDDTAINQIVEQTNAVTASRKAIDEAISAKQREKMTDEELKIALQNETIAQYNAQNAERKRLISYYEAKIATAQAGESVKEYRKELERLKKEDGQVGKKSGFAKFLGQIKRIAIYRLIRTGLKAVTGAFKDGISALAQFDSGINKTMSQLTTSFTVMKLSVSTALLPLLQSITPIIQQISVGFANMANVISASMSKTGYYTKINTDRLIAYNKAANLFDFDKFRALNKGDEASGLLSTEKVEDLNKELGETKFSYSAIFNVIKQISVLAGNLFETVRQIIDAVATSPVTAILLNVAQTLIGIVAGVVNLLNKSGLLKPIVNAILIYLTGWGASKVINGISTLYGKFGMLGVTLTAITVALGIIGNWDNFSEGTKKAITVISTLITVLTTAAFAALALNSALTLGTGVALAVTAFSAGAVMLKGFGLFADGGLPDKGSLFVAGEQGAEFVYNMPSGQSGVANVQQIAQAMKAGCLAALQEYGASRGDISDISFDLDGEQIYRNTTSHASKHGNKWAKV